jgi:hypothetical protein
METEQERHKRIDRKGIIVILFSVSLLILFGTLLCVSHSKTETVCFGKCYPIDINPDDWTGHREIWCDAQGGKTYTLSKGCAISCGNYVPPEAVENKCVVAQVSNNIIPTRKDSITKIYSSAGLTPIQCNQSIEYATWEGCPTDEEKIKYPCPSIQSECVFGSGDETVIIKNQMWTNYNPQLKED